MVNECLRRGGTVPRRHRRQRLRLQRQRRGARSPGPGPVRRFGPGNRHGAWQGAFRVGHQDAVALRYAVEVTGGVDAVALTHLDTAARYPLRLCRSYRVDGQRLTRITPGPPHDLRGQERLTGMLLRARPEYFDPNGDWPGVIEEVTGAPVVLRSYGPTSGDKRGIRAALPA